MKRNPVCRFLPITRIASVTVALFAAFLLPLMAEDDREVVIRRVSGKIQIDGLLNETDWKENPNPIDLVQVEPHPGEPPTEATKV